jgi:riboflavin synthase
MFTGIIEETAAVVGREKADAGLRLQVAASFTDELEIGQSVAVSGACLTVEQVVPGSTEADPESFELFLSQETVEKTYLGEIEVGEPVNLERALPADGRFDGHFVQGHVDGTAKVTGIDQIGDDWTFSFSLPESVGRYVVPKGSICVDGISLTVAELREDEFDVAVIPETYRLTNLANKIMSDPVHLEVDVVAKYVESLTEGYR